MLHSTASNASVDVDIRALEDQRCNAMVAGDIGVLGRLLGDDLFYVHASSRVDTKSSFLSSLQSGTLKFERIERDDVIVRSYNATAAIVTGRAKVFVRSKGEVKEVHIRFTNVWTRPDAHSGDWRFVTWHAAKLPPAGP